MTNVEMKKINFSLSILLILPAIIWISSCNQATDQNDDSQEEVAAPDLDFAEENRTSAIPTEFLKTGYSDEYGEFITDSTGRALYIFSVDSTLTSFCYDECANVWPPYLSGETSLPQAGPGVNEGLITSFERRTGELQLGYSGYPLYYYTKDRKDTTKAEGQGIFGFGGEWYLISPEGNVIR